MVRISLPDNRGAGNKNIRDKIMSHNKNSWHTPDKVKYPFLLGRRSAGESRTEWAA
jgi:hypothetical protein